MLDDSDFRRIRQIIQEEMKTLVETRELQAELAKTEDRIVKRINQ
jgi:hypothetical protein